MTVDMLTTIRELHSRAGDGIHVRLLWCQSSDRVFVAVNDAKTGNAFSVEVPDRSRALHAFHHPFAYAA